MNLLGITTKEISFYLTIKPGNNQDSQSYGITTSFSWY
ncbi:hypothetical protein NC653_030412 [Populus alba x Populus x berolinensis]|uniref:Uncharacterized protein n=1 Tax=Populus alba x Populus x berolinensis TaxID=444605 RepID=A0AAD6Q218_9ROSI|nr:hypothetical protein NC653_030412 [Populus alba x Populus x berolinensis]